MAAQHAPAGDYSTRYKFNGKELDEATGLYYYGARYYDPKISTWLSVDPLAEKYQAYSPYNYTLNNPINLIDPDGRSVKKGDDWYEDKVTKEKVWFNGSFKIEGYNKLGYHLIESETDINNKTTTMKYDGKTKSSYVYNSETAKYDLVKNYDNGSIVKNAASGIVNAGGVVTQQLGEAVVVAFQGLGLMIFETIRGNFDPDEGGDIAKLGYKPAFDLKSTLMYNNGKYVRVNLYSEGNAEAFKMYADSLVAVTPMKTNFFKNEWVNKGVSFLLKKIIRKIL